MTAERRAPRRWPSLAAAALLTLGACSHENSPTPVPVLHAIDVSAASLATEEGGPPAWFDVVLRSPPAAAVDVEVRSDDPTEGLVVSTGSSVPMPVRELTFTSADWDVPRRVAIHPVDDHEDDGTVRYAITLCVVYSDDAGYARIPPVTVAVANSDDDAAGILLSTHALVTREDGTPATFTVRLATAPLSPVLVRATTSDPGEGLLLGPGDSDPHDSVDVAFWPTDWSMPRTIAVVGQPDGVLDGDQVATVTISVVSGDPDHVSLPPQVLPFTNVDDPATALLAVHDTALGAPACAAVASGCSTGALVAGRGPSAGPDGAGEPHQPNTLADPGTGARCADGTGGAYRYDESLEALKVFTVDGSPLAPGATVRIEATVFVFSASQDTLDLYFAADATAPAWTWLASLRALAPGEQVLSFTYTLPAGTLQAIRGGWRYVGSAAPCTSGSFDDRDDLVFAVAPP